MKQNLSFYTLLGVSEQVKDDELKKAYRKLAIKFHPDLNQGSLESEKIFKQITEAYATLSNPSARLLYDLSGYKSSNIEISTTENKINVFKSKNFFDSVGLSGKTNNYLKIFHSDKTIYYQSYSKKPQYEIFFRSGFFKKEVHYQKRKKISFYLELDLKEAVFGCEKKILYQQESINIDQVIIIPPNIQNNDLIKLSYKYFDLHITISVKPNRYFKRLDKNLFYTLYVKHQDLLLGNTKSIKTLNDKNLQIQIEPKSLPETIIRLASHGAPSNEGNGDLYIKLRLAPIKYLTRALN